MAKPTKPTAKTKVKKASAKTSVKSPVKTIDLKKRTAGKTKRSELYDIIFTKYLKQYPDYKDFTLARKIFAENPQHFTSFESVRAAIKKRRGHDSNNKTKDTTFHTPITYDTRNTIVSLKNRAPKLKVFTLPTGIKNVLFLSDIHLPYQDDIALNIALQYGKDNNVDCIWLNGDILDMYGASDHEKLPDHAMISEEFEVAYEFFAQLRAAFPKATIYYKEGNHERRWLRLLMRKAQELLGLKEFELNIILRLEEFKIHWIENETLVKFGKLNVLHGNEFKGSGGVNPARALYMRARANAIAGDKHKTGENNEGDLDGHLTTTWAVGCLCDLNPKYMPFAHTIWNLGFAHIIMNGKEFHVKNYRIHKNKIL